jgi:hypothetical protein
MGSWIARRLRVGADRSAQELMETEAEAEQESAHQWSKNQKDSLQNCNVWLIYRLNLLKYCFVRFLVQVRKISQSLHYYAPGELARARCAAPEIRLCLVYQKIEVPAS